jgi:hypothetical protein
VLSSAHLQFIEILVPDRPPGEGILSVSFYGARFPVDVLNPVLLHNTL